MTSIIYPQGEIEQLAAQSLFIDLARNEDKELSGVAGDPWESGFYFYLAMSHPQISTESSP